MLTGTCNVCGEEMTIDSNGIATHSSHPEDIQDTFELDADHVPVSADLDV